MKIKSILLFFIISIALVIANLLQNSTQPVYSQETDTVVAEVYLVEAYEVDDVLTEMSRYDIQPSTIIREYAAGEQTYTEGYNLEASDWQDTPDLRSLYWQSHGGMLTDIQASIERQSEEKEFNELEAIAWQEFVEGANASADEFTSIEGCWENNECPDVQIKRLMVVGSNDSLQQLADESDLVSSIEIWDETAAPDPTPVPSETSAPEPVGASSRADAFSAVTSSIANWLPNYGTIDIKPSSTPGQRYVLNLVYWHTSDRVSGFDATSAYEHDFFLNDSDTSQYGPGTYLDDSQSINEVPIVEHWSSTLPSPYLDTRLTDDDYFKAFTIGSADGNAIQSGTYYNYYIRTVNGDASTDNGFLQAQLGYRSPSWCYTTWCVFGSSYVDIYNEYDVDPIPGTFSWTLRELNETIWRGNQGWTRPVAVDNNGNIQWGIAESWSGPDGLSSLPGSGTLQTQVNYRVGNTLVQGIWRNDQGWTRNVPIADDVIQWGSAPAWSGPISISSMPGSGSMQAHGDYAVGNTLVQGVWRNNQGWTRDVPIVNGVIQWGQAGAWSGPISIGGLPGSGDMQVQDNFVTGNTYWQVIWRSNQQYTRSVPIVNGVIQWGQASGWSNTTAQEDLPGSGTVQTQANFVFP